MKTTQHTPGKLGIVHLYDDRFSILDPNNFSKKELTDLIASAPELLKENEQLKQDLQEAEQRSKDSYELRLELQDAESEKEKLQALNTELLEALRAIKSITNDVIPELEDIAEYSRNELRSALIIINGAIAKAESK